MTCLPGLIGKRYQKFRVTVMRLWLDLMKLLTGSGQLWGHPGFCFNLLILYIPWPKKTVTFPKDVKSNQTYTVCLENQWKKQKQNKTNSNIQFSILVLISGSSSVNVVLNCHCWHLQFLLTYDFLVWPLHDMQLKALKNFSKTNFILSRDRTTFPLTSNIWENLSKVNILIKWKKNPLLIHSIDIKWIINYFVNYVLSFF